MIKYIPQFSCWRFGPLVFYVIASEVVSKTVVHLLVTADGKSCDVVLPDALDGAALVYPCKYVAMPAMVRVRCREHLAKAVEAEIGQEWSAPFEGTWNSSI